MYTLNTPKRSLKMSYTGKDILEEFRRTEGTGHNWERLSAEDVSNFGDYDDYLQLITAVYIPHCAYAEIGYQSDELDAYVYHYHADLIRDIKDILAESRSVPPVPLVRSVTNLNTPLGEHEQFHGYVTLNEYTEHVHDFSEKVKVNILPMLGTATDITVEIILEDGSIYYTDSLDYSDADIICIPFPIWNKLNKRIKSMGTGYSYFDQSYDRAPHLKVLQCTNLHDLIRHLDDSNTAYFGHDILNRTVPRLK